MAQSLDMSDGLTRPPLPDFADPPVVEVALGVQFQPPVELSPLDLGPLRERWRDRFPRLEQQPPLPPVVEAERASQLGVQVVVGAAPMVRQHPTDRRRGGNRRSLPSSVRQKTPTRFAMRTGTENRGWRNQHDWW